MRPLSKLPYGVPSYAEDNSPGVQVGQSLSLKENPKENKSALPQGNKENSVNMPIINSRYRGEESGDDGASLVSSPDESEQEEEHKE